MNSVIYYMELRQTKSVSDEFFSKLCWKIEFFNSIKFRQDLCDKLGEMLNNVKVYSPNHE